MQQSGDPAISSQFHGIPPVEPASETQLDPEAQQLPEAVSPATGPTVVAARQQSANLEELALAGTGNFPEDDAFASSGNRWPRQETLALLKIRSEMDSAFRDATLKGPLWDEVSRKLAELGYKRNAKKCREKFENVHKYYKRTKDGRASRQDGKSYKFFSELEALHTSSGISVTKPTPISAISVAPISAAVPLPSNTVVLPSPARTAPDIAPQPLSGLQAVAAAAAGMSFSSDSSEDDGEFDDEDTDEAGAGEERREGRKRKRGGEERASSKKMMAFFDGLVTKLIERQEAMQQRFLETIEKREQDRMIREEAWRRQEMAQLSHEQELLAQERAMAASRDALLISYLKKISSDQSTPLPVVFSTGTTEPPPVEKAPLAPTPQQQTADNTTTELGAASEQQEFGESLSYEPVSSSRWPKAEVHALIDIRSGFESRYQEAGPKGPLWEEISAEMQKIGYSRSAKRCKEKWENINKYFKKVKESNKKRPEDAKTCPYFHQLDALYRHKKLGLGGEIQQQEVQGIVAMTDSSTQEKQQQVESEDNGNGLAATNIYEQGVKKPEDITKELMQQQPEIANEEDSDNMDQNYSDNYDEDEDDEENDKMQYKIQYQGSNVSGNDSFLAIVR